MDIKQTAERFRSITEEQAAEIIRVFESWGYKEVRVSYQSNHRGKSRVERASEQVHIFVEAEFP